MGRAFKYTFFGFILGAIIGGAVFWFTGLEVIPDFLFVHWFTNACANMLSCDWCFECGFAYVGVFAVVFGLIGYLMGRGRY
ncbi:hypothetical protein ACFL1B_05060 [Nanoarchaeota archaeon]